MTKRKKTIIIILLITIVLGLIGKFAFDFAVNYTINKALETVLPEIEKLSKEHPELLIDAAESVEALVPATGLSPETDDPSSSVDVITDSSKIPSFVPVPDENTKVSSYTELEKYMDPSDVDRAKSIVFSIISADKIPYILQLLAQNTPESKNELKQILRNMTASQKIELVNLYNKYSHLLKYVKE